MKSQRTEPIKARILERTLRFTRATSKRELVAHELAIVTVDHRAEVGPAVPATRYVAHIHRPAKVTLFRTAPDSLGSRPRSLHALIDEPALYAKDSVDRLAVHLESLAEAKNRPDPWVTERRMLIDHGTNRSHQVLIEPCRFRPLRTPIAT